jgi:hypothetical protein
MMKNIDSDVVSKEIAGSVVWWLACRPLVPQITGSNPAAALRHCATNRKVTGSIPDGTIRIFN